MVLIDVAPVLPDLLPLGLVGVSMVSWLGDDGADEVDQDGGVEEDFEMEDDEEFGMDGFDDDFDDLDGMEDGDGASSTELENRIEDLESEVADVSSTANTVRSENEQISEQVDEVEENVRKLLEIYEMVTRGVNPFVDDVSPDAGVGGGGDFGLFGDEGEESTEDEADLEADIADAEAEEFFDDDAFDDEFGDEEFDAEEPEAEADLEAEFGGDDLDDADDGLDDGAFDDGLEEDFEDTGTEETMNGEDTDGDGGGTSFEELKAEYESGDADWAEEESLEAEEESLEPETDEGTTTAPAADEATPDDGLTPESEEDADLFKQDDLEAGDSSVSVANDGEEETADPAAESAVTEAPESPTESVEESAEESLREDAGFQFGAATAADPDQRPHLETPPNGYLADVLIMEWLSFLEGEFDARNAMRALNHYERIGWIGEATREHCYAVLSGLTEGQSPYPDETGPTELSMDDHRRSLRYIEELATGHLDRELGERLSATSRDGIQR